MLAFWRAVHALHGGAVAQDEGTLLHLLHLGALPFAGVSALAAVVPFIMYLSFGAEFGRLHPLAPRGYAFLARRVWGAAAANEMKVSAKEL